MVEYFKILFSTSGCTTEPIIKCIQRKVSKAHNHMLTKKFEVKEVQEAVFSMYPNKLPDSDGMNPRFDLGAYAIMLLMCIIKLTLSRTGFNIQIFMV